MHRKLYLVTCSCCVWTENWQKAIASIWGDLGPAVALMMFGSSIDTLPPARHTHSWLVLYLCICVFMYLCTCVLMYLCVFEILYGMVV